MITKNVGGVTEIHHWATIYVIGLKQHKVIEGGVIIILTSHERNFLQEIFKLDDHFMKRFVYILNDFENKGKQEDFGR